MRQYFSPLLRDGRAAEAGAGRRGGRRRRRAARAAVQRRARRAQPNRLARISHEGQRGHRCANCMRFAIRCRLPSVIYHVSMVYVRIATQSSPHTQITFGQSDVSMCILLVE
jgi:hypothetical protein